MSRVQSPFSLLVLLLLSISAAGVSGCGKSVNLETAQTLSLTDDGDGKDKNPPPHPISCLVYDLRPHYERFFCPIDKIFSGEALTKEEVLFCGYVAGKLPDFNTLNPVDRIYIPQFDVEDTKWIEGFPYFPERLGALREWFGLSCSTRIVAPHEGWYWFRLRSDDGSRLYINGLEVINNDGVHPPQTKHGDFYLFEGENETRIDYYQGPREYIALKLMWKLDMNAPAFEVIPESSFSSSNRHDWFSK